MIATMAGRPMARQTQYDERGEQDGDQNSNHVTDSSMSDGG